MASRARGPRANSTSQVLTGYLNPLGQGPVHRLGYSNISGLVDSCGQAMALGPHGLFRARVDRPRSGARCRRVPGSTLRRPRASRCHVVDGLVDVAQQ